MTPDYHCASSSGQHESHRTRAANAMSAQTATVRLAVIDNDSGFLRVLTSRFDAAGWEYRVHPSGVPAEELVAMKLNALVVDVSILGPMAGSSSSGSAGCFRISR